MRSFLLLLLVLSLGLGLTACGSSEEGASGGGPAVSDEEGHARIMKLWSEGNALRGKKDFAAAQAKYEEALPYAKTVMKGVFLPAAHNQLIDTLEAAGKKAEALVHAKAALDAAKKLGKASEVKRFEERIAALQ